MGTTLREKMAAMSPERREAIEAEADILHAEYLSLQDLRKAQNLTQVQLAETLGIKQPTLAEMEKNTDLMMSTLKRYIEAMGGKLNVVVEFPDRPTLRLEAFSSETLTHEQQIKP